jgi:hypothetical protein
MSEALQGEFNFRGEDSGDGYSQWVVARRVAVDVVAAKLRLPLGRLVELWLRGGVRLRGKLRLQNEILFVEEDRLNDLALVLDEITFKSSEIESWVRLD